VGAWGGKTGQKGGKGKLKIGIHNYKRERGLSPDPLDREINEKLQAGGQDRVPSETDVIVKGEVLVVLSKE